MNINKFIFLLALVSVVGCATIPIFRDGSSVAEGIANKAGFSKEYIKAGSFTLMTYQRFNGRSNKLSVYIEGDGRAWLNRYQLSSDPTPLNPVALKLASVDPSDNIAYVARPGQYSATGIPDCDLRYWSGSRFSEEVINSINVAIDQLKEKSRASSIELTGYSGGGAVAVLVAARRNDVILIRTVAGNLNLRVFCQYHHVSLLDDSLDPMDFAQKVAGIPQRHFVGSKDDIVPSFIAQSFVRQEGDRDYHRVTVVEGNTHAKGWQECWRALLKT